MKLSECKIGVVVIEKLSEQYERIGHVVGIAYNLRLSLTQGMSHSELRERTIPIVRFADEEIPIHHCNLEIYNDSKNYDSK